MIVQSNTGKLFTVTPDRHDGGDPARRRLVPNGDGILLDGRTLYVVQNQLNQIAKIRLAHGLTSGQIVGTITDSDFDIPATVDKLGKNLWAVNARFTTPPTPDTTYSVVKTKK